MRTYLYTLLFIFFVHEGFSQGLLNPEEEKVISEKMEFGNTYIIQFPFSNFQKPKPNKEIRNESTSEQHKDRWIKSAGSGVFTVLANTSKPLKTIKTS